MNDTLVPVRLSNMQVKSWELIVTTAVVMVLIIVVTIRRII